MELSEGGIPAPRPDQALVRVERVGLCGSDYHIYDGTHPYAVFPQVQGHEFVGVVAELPDGYSGPHRAGDRVVVNPLRGCGRCFPCTRGRPNCCVDVTVLGVQLPGGLADHVAVPVDQLVAAAGLPADLAVLSEPVAIGLHAVNRGGIADGDRVVVTGAGPIGLAATLAAVDRGARVLVADRIASRLEAAARAGAERVVDTASEDLAEAVDAFTGGWGPAVVVEATGVPALVRLAVDLVAHSGTVVVVGISTADVGLRVSDLSRKEINLLGSRNSAGEFPAAVDLVMRRADVLAGWVTHTFGLDEVPKAIEFARANPDLVEKVVISCAAD
ncbi:alcohol dehydrogenase catalytic domain-containing protein [Rugosimonospora acidiphila]